MIDRAVITSMKPVTTKTWLLFICYTLFLIKQYENVAVKNY